MGWESVGKLGVDGASQIIVTLTDGKVEEFGQIEDYRTGAQVFQSNDKETAASDNNLQIGFWDDEGEWHATALFLGKTYLYVRTK